MDSSSNGPASEPSRDQVCNVMLLLSTAELHPNPLPCPRPPLLSHTHTPTVRAPKEVHGTRSSGKPNKKKNKHKITKTKSGSTKQQGEKPVLWVDLFRCFLCGTEGRSPPLGKCTQCEVAYYCGKTCQ